MLYQPRTACSWQLLDHILMLMSILQISSEAHGNFEFIFLWSHGNFKTILIQTMANDNHNFCHYIYPTWKIYFKGHVKFTLRTMGDFGKFSFYGSSKFYFMGRAKIYFCKMGNLILCNHENLIFEPLQLYLFWTMENSFFAPWLIIFGTLHIC